jgi:hypothetical protein
MDDTRAPGQVLAMARKAGGQILRWRDDGVQFIVLLTDGRKLYEPIGKSKPEPKPKNKGKGKDPEPKPKNKGKGKVPEPKPKNKGKGKDPEPSTELITGP